jgi:DNA polymerase (family 10)
LHEAVTLSIPSSGRRKTRPRDTSRRLENLHVDVLAHPRGRIYNFRAELDVDGDLVLDTAAEYDKAVEIDCFPDRQDLNVSLLRKAKRAGVRISIGTDAHSVP